MSLILMADVGLARFSRVLLKPNLPHFHSFGSLSDLCKLLKKLHKFFFVKFGRWTFMQLFLWSLLSVTLRPTSLMRKLNFTSFKCDLLIYEQWSYLLVMVWCCLRYLYSHVLREASLDDLDEQTDYCLDEVWEKNPFQDFSTIGE